MYEEPEYITRERFLMHLSIDTKYYSCYFNLYLFTSFFFFHPTNLYYFQNIRNLLSLSLSLVPPPTHNRFLRCVVLYIEIGFAGYNRLLMCSLIPPKTQNRCFCVIYRHTKMTFFYFNPTLTPPPQTFSAVPTHTQKCYYNCFCSDKVMDACMWNFGLKAQFF